MKKFKMSQVMIAVFFVFCLPDLDRVGDAKIVHNE